MSEVQNSDRVVAFAGASASVDSHQTGMTASERPLRRPSGGFVEDSCSAFRYGHLDPGIVLGVRTLRDAGVETLWSCEGAFWAAVKTLHEAIPRQSCSELEPRRARCCLLPASSPTDARDDRPVPNV